MFFFLSSFSCTGDDIAILITAVVLVVGVIFLCSFLAFAAGYSNSSTLSNYLGIGIERLFLYFMAASGPFLADKSTQKFPTGKWKLGQHIHVVSAPVSSPSHSVL